jgi:hypothetical protein
MTRSCFQVVFNTRVIQTVLTRGVRFLFVATFLAAFFSRRGNRLLFLFASLGTFGFRGAVIPTAAAIVPAAAPMLLAAAVRTPSGGSCACFLFAIW